MNQLRMAPDFGLPVSAVTETIAILGRRGSGKTNTAVVMAEELLEKGLQILVIDPTDVWYGLKSSVHGDRPGYPVVILGGRRGDLPLAAGDGATIADFIVESGASVVCSLRHFESQRDERHFVTDLARRIYYRKGQEASPSPIMVIIDEASRMVPQRVGAEEAPLVGAIQRLVRQGRSSGFGVTLIDQRPASVHKDVLTQLEFLVCHQVTSPQDSKAIEAWIEQHDVQNQRSTVMRSLPSLPVGSAWFWSPSLDILQSVSVRARRTFDSSRTPKAGERAITPVVFAELDLEKLKAKLATTIERARDEDPRALRHRIAALEAELARARAGAPDPEALERARAEGAEQRRAEAWVFARDIQARAGDLRALAASLEAKLGILVMTADRAADETSPKHRVTTPAPVHTPPVRPVPALAAPSRPAAPQTGSSGEPVPKGERVVLAALAVHADGVSRAHLTVQTGFKRSTRDTYIQRLSARGLVRVDGDRIVATPAGIQALGSDYEPLPTGKALRDHWVSRLPQGESSIFQIVVADHPHPVDRETISRRTGFKRSTRDTYIQRLSARMLVTTGPDGVSASPHLF